MMLAVVPKVALLAHCLEVHRIAVLGLVIEVCDREHDSTVGEFSIGVILFPAAPTAMQSAFALAFAKTTGALKYGRSDLRPVLRVTVSIVRMYWHVGEVGQSVCQGCVQSPQNDQQCL